MFVYPSRLPDSELQLIQSSLHASVLRLGFRSGIFHVEARVHNSSMHYAVDAGGILKLVLGLKSVTAIEPRVFLIEINARPPADFGLMTIATTYGVDYFALHARRALDDEARFKALACSFANKP